MQNTALTHCVEKHTVKYYAPQKFFVAFRMKKRARIFS